MHFKSIIFFPSPLSNAPMIMSPSLCLVPRSISSSWFHAYVHLMPMLIPCSCSPHAYVWSRAHVHPMPMLIDLILMLILWWCWSYVHVYPMPMFVLLLFLHSSYSHVNPMPMLIPCSCSPHANVDPMFMFIPSLC